MEESILTQLQNLRALYAETMPTDKKRQENYAWIVVKSINKHAEEMGSLMCRQLLSDVMKMPLERPSLLYSSILWSAIKVASLFPEFHFVPFLNMWCPAENLRKEDYEPKKDYLGREYPSLSERVVKTMLIAQLIRPDEVFSTPINIACMGYHPVTQMIVTKVSKECVNGRDVWFATLVGADGTEVSTEMHKLRRNPLVQSDKKHYVNIGQMYDVVCKDKPTKTGMNVVDGVLSSRNVLEVFHPEVGYVENFDANYGQIHIYDGQSRHFVSSGQKFVKVEKGQLVTFIPIVPKTHQFKSAIIISSRDSIGELRAKFPLREIRITHENAEKQYYSWELTDKDNPITETLSSFQMSQGNSESPSFVSGFINMDVARQYIPNIAVGTVAKAIIFLRRGKDKQKRPFVAFMMA